ncbi:MAG: hypothetical protein OER90_10310 [Gemmatimonadota bacterium]|nr:hypothetical protein [Gemmatimonadota bacterium]
MRRFALLAMAALSAACEFGEVTVPTSDPLVIVQAIMRPDVARQWLIVEQTLTGSAVIDGEPIVVPGAPLPLPVSGATVTVTNRTDPNDPCGTTVFTEDPGVPDIPVAAGVYWGPAGCPTMRAGDTLELRVVTPGGAVVTGTSEVPGVTAFVMRVASSVVEVPGPVLTLNRDVDSLKADAAVIAGRALQLEVRRPTVLGSSVPGFWFVVDSTAITVPGDLPDIVTAFLQDTSGIPDEFPPVFAAGRHYAVTVAVGDARYFDFVRSGNIPPSGRGFVNNLQGGMGVFGSLVAATNAVRVVGNLDDGREGFYRVTGDLLGVAVDATLELYVATADADSTELSAFVSGAWLHGSIDESADGVFRADTLSLVIEQLVPSQRDSVSVYLLVGPTAPSTATTLTAYDAERRVVDSLTVERVPRLAVRPIPFPQP